jgi:hypothetical protein
MLPLANNPATVTLESQNQLARLGREIFAAESGTEQLGWVILDTDNPQLGSFFQFGSARQLDGSVAVTRQYRRLFFTRVYEGETAFRGQPVTTLLTIANPNHEPVTVELALHAPLNGASALKTAIETDSITREIPARGFVSGELSDFFDIQSVEGGYIQVDVTEGEGAVGFQLIRLEKERTVIGLNASPENQAGRLYSAQLASDSALFTSIKLVNTSQEERSVIASAIAADGSPLVEDAVILLAPGESGEWDAGELFENEEAENGTVNATSQTQLLGSLRLAAEGPGIIGDVIFGDRVNFKFAAALPLQSRTFTDAVFSQVANIPGFFTGLAFFNPGPLDAEMEIQVVSASGEVVGEVARQVLAGQRLSKLVDELVPDSAGQAGGFVRVQSNRPLVAQVLFGALDSENRITLFSAVPPTLIETNY